MNGMTDVHKDWAKRLTSSRIALDLQRLAENIRYYEPATREAILREAASRLKATDQ